MQQEIDTNNQTHESSASQQWGTTRLRILVLVPMAIVIALDISLALYEYTSRDVADTHKKLEPSNGLMI